MEDLYDFLALPCQKHVSVHSAAPHLLCCRALEVQKKVHLRVRRRASACPVKCEAYFNGAAPCKRLQLGGSKRIGRCTPVGCKVIIWKTIAKRVDNAANGIDIVVNAKIAKR
jgi:hypothetical protein